MSEWWLSRGDGKTEGPLTTQVLVEGLVAGKIPKQSHVCAVGEKQWHLVSQIDEIWEAVDPSQSTTSVTETPWFVDSADSGKQKLVEVDAIADQRTQVISSPSTSGGAAVRPPPQTAHANASRASAARPSHAPPVPRRVSPEAAPNQSANPTGVLATPPPRARSLSSPAAAELAVLRPTDANGPIPTAARADTAVAPPRNFVRASSQTGSEPIPGASFAPTSSSSPSRPIAAGLTPLGLKPQEPLSSAKPFLAGLAGLSPLPGAVNMATSRQQAAPALEAAAPAPNSAQDSPKIARAESSRPSAPPASRNLYGASPLSGTRPQATITERPTPARNRSSLPSPEAQQGRPITSEAPSPPRPSPRSGQTSSRAAQPSHSESQSESSVTIQPIITLAAAPAPPKLEPAPHVDAELVASSAGSAAAIAKPPPAPSARLKAAKSPPPRATAEAPNPSDSEWDNDDPTQCVARPAMESAILETLATRAGVSNGHRDPPQEADDDATTLLQARVEPNRTSHTAPSTDTRTLGRVEGAIGSQALPQMPRGADLAALAAEHALGPDSIVADPNQLLADVDDEPGPPEIPIVQLPVVAPRVIPNGAPPVATAPSINPPISAAPTALAAPPSTPPPAHNPRLSVPTIVLKPEPIVHQEATQPAVRALRKRSPFHLSYGSLIGMILVIAVASLAAYLTLVQR